jgi:hypothetical protein
MIDLPVPTVMHVWFGGLLGLFPGLVTIAMIAWALVGLANSGPIHVREHVLDMLPGGIAVLVIILIVSLTR